MKDTQKDLDPEKSETAEKKTEAPGGTLREAPDAAPSEESGNDRPKEKRSKKWLLLLIGTGVLALGGATGTGVYLGWLKIPGISSQEKARPAPAQAPSIGPMVKLPPLVINLNEENGRHYIKTTLVLEIARAEAMGEVQSKIPSFTDMAILALGDKHLEDLRKADSKEDLKKELLEKANQVIPEGKIRGIYFDEFLFQ